MRSILRKFPQALLLFLTMGSSNVIALADMMVSPVHIVLSANHPIVTLHIYNDGNTPASFETKELGWQQHSDKNVFSSLPKNNFIVTPTVFTVQPKKIQILRVGMLAFIPSKQERSYRLFIQEIKKKPSKQGDVISMLLKISLPIFIQPIKHHVSTKLTGTIMPATHQLKLQLINQGNVHIETYKITLSDTKHQQSKTAKLFDYVLAGKYKRWVLPLPKNLINSHQVNATLLTNIGKIEQLIK